MNAFYGALIGAGAAWLVSALVRYFNLPQEIREHDRLVFDLDDDLSLYVADEKARLDRRLEAIPGEVKRDHGTVRIGETTHQLRVAKENTLHLYRDRQRETLQRVAEIRGRERWRHLVMRHIHPRLSHFPELTAPTRAEPILEDWRSDACFQDLPARAINDPTKRTLETALGELGTQR